MTAHRDAHARPPDDLRLLYKRYQKASNQALDTDPDLFDALRSPMAPFDHPDLLQTSPEHIDHVYSRFLGSHSDVAIQPQVYEHPSVPGRLPESLHRLHSF